MPGEGEFSMLPRHHVQELRALRLSDWHLCKEPAWLLDFRPLAWFANASGAWMIPKRARSGISFPLDRQGGPLEVCVAPLPSCALGPTRCRTVCNGLEFHGLRCACSSLPPDAQPMWVWSERSLGACGISSQSSP
jgi:hypothetical protein